MIGMNIVVIDGEEVELKKLPKEERQRLREEWNERAVRVLGYERIKLSATKMRATV